MVKELVAKILERLNLDGADAHRLLHGRGGYIAGWEHLAIDLFPPVMLVTFYGADERNSALVEGLLEGIASLPGVTSLVVQERHLPGAPKRAVVGHIPDNFTAHESGLRYQLNLERNQNHGFFLDMKPGRDWVRANSEGKHVLNLFSYTCSLSVAAMAGGAESVTNLDMASGALTTGRANHRLNFDDDTCRRVKYLPHDLFKSWGKLKRGAPYDLVIIDPPSNQPGSVVVEKDYQRIVHRLPSLTKPESTILACLNAPHLDEGFLTELFASYRFGGRLPPAPGFEDKHPERALKAMLFSRKAP